MYLSSSITLPFTCPGKFHWIHFFPHEFKQTWLHKLCLKQSSQMAWDLFAGVVFGESEG